MYTLWTKKDFLVLAKDAPSQHYSTTVQISFLLNMCWTSNAHNKSLLFHHLKKKKIASKATLFISQNDSYNNWHISPFYVLPLKKYPNICGPSLGSQAKGSNENLDMAEKNQERQMQASFSVQVSKHYKHGLGVWAEVVSDKSSTQEIWAKELSFIPRSPVQWQEDRDGLRNKSVFGFENLLCENRYRACCQPKVNLSLNSAFSWPTEDSQLHTSVCDVRRHKKRLLTSFPKEKWNPFPTGSPWIRWQDVNCWASYEALQMFHHHGPPGWQNLI